MGNPLQYYRALRRGAVGPNPLSFIMTFALGASDSITLPLTNNGVFNFVVDWGDGTSNVITAWNQAERVHAYTGLPAGDYTVSITGLCPAWAFGSVTTSRLKLKRVTQWGTVPKTLFWVNAFNGCTNLLSVPAGLDLTGVTTIQGWFQNCSNLANLPSGFLVNASSLTGFLVSFFNCDGFTSIPSDLFSGISSSGASFSQTFQNCNNITSIPATLFINQTAGSTSFNSTFQGCTGITAIPTDLFRYNVTATSFQSTFASTSITSIPTEVFRYNTSVTNFMGVFQSCTGITSIPIDLFRYNTAVNTFSTVFFGCTGLTTIPTDIFRYNTSVISFFNAFYACTNLATLPTDVFRYNTAVTTFAQCFALCSNLTALPTDLFRYNTAVTTFSFTFQNCVDLLTIPSDFFNFNTLVTTYFNTFLGCSFLAISISSLVAGMDMTRVTTTNQMFSACTSITGNGQDLIDKPKAAGYTVGTGSGTGSHRTFFNCTALTDFATISANYK